eukprot:g14090.t1
MLCPLRSNSDLLKQPLRSKDGTQKAAAEAAPCFTSATCLQLKVERSVPSAAGMAKAQSVVENLLAFGAAVKGCKEVLRVHCLYGDRKAGVPCLPRGGEHVLLAVDDYCNHSLLSGEDV